MGFFLIGQTSFFIVIKQVEATRASSLLGLKLLVPALISVVIGRPLSSLRWPALVLCTADAVGMNFPASCLPASAIQEITLRWALKKLPASSAKESAKM